MPERRRGPSRELLAVAAVLVLTGCTADPATPAAPGPSAGVTTPGPASATPSPASASPGPASASPAASSATPSPTPRATPRATPSGAESQTYATDLELAADGQVGFTPLRWYQGQRAEDRCRQVSISSPTAWCHDYYYEKSGATTRATLAPDAAITLLDDDARLTKAGAAQLRQAVAGEAWPHFRLWLVGTEIRRVEQVYTP